VVIERPIVIKIYQSMDRNKKIMIDINVVI